MNFFKRLFKIGQAEVHSTIDDMEDPIKMSEQGIRDMKSTLSKSLESLAQVKAMAIRAKNDVDELVAKGEDYQEKAILILKKVQSGDLETQEADRLAKEALIKKEETNKRVVLAQKEAKQFNRSVADLEQNVQEIKQDISKWENELKTLKARVKVAEATKSLNKQMADIDNSSTVSMLERMKEKVQQEEALAEAYGDISRSDKSIDKEIDNAASIIDTSAEEDLIKLKENLGLTDK